MIRNVFLIAALTAAAIIAGCGNLNRKPLYNVNEPYTVEPYKRHMKHMEQDFIFRRSSRAYKSLGKPLTKRLSESEQDVLLRHGQPDYIRDGWRSQSGEIVNDWAWWDRGIIVQFVQGEAVFEGPLTDLDRSLIRYGYPRYAKSQITTTDIRRDVLEYHPLTNANEGRVLTFTGEELVSVQEY